MTHDLPLAQTSFVDVVTDLWQHIAITVQPNSLATPYLLEIHLAHLQLSHQLVQLHPRWKQCYQNTLRKLSLPSLTNLLDQAEVDCRITVDPNTVLNS